MDELRFASRCSGSLRFVGLRAAVLGGLSVAFTAQPAMALSRGTDQSNCGGCHASAGFDGEASLVAGSAFELGQTTDFTLTINESHMGQAGFWISTGGVGSLNTVTGSGARSLGKALVHSAPVEATDHTAVIHFTWTAPTTPGVVDFYVSVVAVNGQKNGTASDDRFGQLTLSKTFGCEALTLYEDIDGDGFGDPEFTSERCAEDEDWVLKSGDCNDLWATIYPGAPERANGKDNNCDGMVDEGGQDDLGYVDADGDGFGNLLGVQMSGVLGLSGYARTNDDCDDTDPSIHPGAEDVCDGHDNNCDGATDEDKFQYCGVGRCSQRVEGCTASCVPGQPYAETCNGLDDDCDGETDEGELCAAGETCLQFRCQALGAVGSASSVSSTDASAAPSQSHPDAGANASAAASTGAAVGSAVSSASSAGAPVASTDETAPAADSGQPPTAGSQTSAGTQPSVTDDSAADQPTGGCRLVLGERPERANLWGLALLVLLVVRRRQRSIA